MQFWYRFFECLPRNLCEGLRTVDGPGSHESKSCLSWCIEQDVQDGEDDMFRLKMLYRCNQGTGELGRHSIPS